MAKLRKAYEDGPGNRNPEPERQEGKRIILVGLTTREEKGTVGEASLNY